jgi:hypothetical protein
VAQELATWNGVAADEAGRRVAHVELSLEIVRGAPKLSYLARRPPGFPEVFEYDGHRFDSLEEGWYDPLPVPPEEGQQLLHGFEWSADRRAGVETFALKRRPTRAIAFVKSEDYTGLTSRRRMLAGVECALLYHESVAEIVEKRVNEIGVGHVRPIVSLGVPVGWRLLLDLQVQASATTVPDLEALEVDAAVELMTVGGLRVGRRAAWLIDRPPQILVSGSPESVLVNGHPAKVGSGGVVEWDRSSREPGVHVIEAGRAHVRVEIIDGSIAERLPSISATTTEAIYSIALARGSWHVVGRNPGEIVDVDLSKQAVLRLPFEPVWALSRGLRGVVLLLTSNDLEPGELLGDEEAVKRWAVAIQDACATDEKPLACLDARMTSNVRRLWRGFARVARRCTAEREGVA